MFDSWNMEKASYLLGFCPQISVKLSCHDYRAPSSSRHQNQVDINIKTTNQNKQPQETTSCTLNPPKSPVLTPKSPPTCLCCRSNGLCWDGGRVQRHWPQNQRAPGHLFRAMGWELQILGAPSHQKTNVFQFFNFQPTFWSIWQSYSSQRHRLWGPESEWPADLTGRGDHPMEAEGQTSKTSCHWRRRRNATAMLIQGA